MGSIINFEERKADNELIAMLEEFEQYMPTPEEVEAKINQVRDKYDFHYEVWERDYLKRTKEVMRQAFTELVDAFHSYEPDSVFSNKRYIDCLQTYDACRALLSDYVFEYYEDTDEPIAELDECLIVYKRNYMYLSAEELKSDIETYIPVVYRIYDIIFDMLEKKDERCCSLGMYSLLIDGIEFHSFDSYILLHKRKKEDQGN